VILGVVVLLAGASALRIARKAAMAVLIFNSIVTVSYTAFSLLQGNFSLHYVALVNLRVFSLTYLTFLLGERVNLFRALAFSPTLMYLATLAYSQVVLFRRLFEEFRLASRSRTIDRPRLTDMYRQGGATASYFLTKSMADAASITQAMKSRGFFND
jgi:cobalt/nickel transport system permease protein